jgi:hypothetical protein
VLKTKEEAVRTFKKRVLNEAP